MACAFLRDQSGAEVAVAQGISDFCARPEQVLTRDDEVARRELARIIYWRCSETSTRWVPSWSQPSLPPAMVWLREISMLQRTTLALCLFGAHSCREAAELLGLPPSRVGTLLRTGVLELTGAGWSPMDFVADVSTTSGDLVGAEAAPTMSTRQR